MPSKKARLVGRKRVNLKLPIHLMLLLPALSIVVFITLFPLVYSLYLSFVNFDMSSLQGPFVGISNYLKVIHHWRFWNSLEITLRLSTIAVTLELLTGFGLALLLNREIRGKTIIRTILLIPMMVTGVSVGVTWLFMLHLELGIVNHLLGLMGVHKVEWLCDPLIAPFSLIAVDVWQWTPFVFMILYAGLQSLPREPYEAAEIDGASRLQTFRFITLPLLKPVILVALLLRLIDAFKIFDIVYVMTRGGPAVATDVFTYYIYRTVFQYLDVSFGSALSYLFFLIVMVFAMMLIRVGGRPK